MRAAHEGDGEVKDEVSRLEKEVATWRSRRIQRRGTTTGKVHVLRISKRVVPQFGPSADQRQLPQGGSGVAGKGRKVS